MVEGEIEVSALILAGGRATRMGGIAKHEIIVQGETILVRQTRVLRELVTDIIVSSPVDIEGFRTVRDTHAGIGPLAGIAAGLAAASTEWLIIVAGDMPYLSGMLLHHMLDVACSAGGRSSDEAAPGWENCHAIGVKVKALPEPLFCVVRVPRAREVVTAMIAANNFKASGLLDALGASYIPEKAARSCDPELLTLHNVNEPSDIR